MPRTLDTATHRFYQAERSVWDMVDNAVKSGNPIVEIHGSSIVIPDERKFGTLENVQEYIERVLRLNWIRDEWPERSRIVPRVSRARTSNRSNYYGTADSGSITIPDHLASDGSLMRELLVLHELAHHLPNTGKHDGAFVDTYLKLLDGALGPEMKLLAYFMLSEMEAI